MAEALHLDAVAVVAWQRFSGKGKGKSKSKGKAKGKGKSKGSNLSLEDRKRRFAELKSRTNCQACDSRGHLAGDDICPKNAKRDGSRQPPARGYLAFGGETPGVAPCSMTTRLQMPQPWSPMHASMPATFRWRYRPRHRQCETITKTTACHSFSASIDTSVRWRMQRVQPSKHESHG